MDPDNRVVKATYGVEGVDGEKNTKESSAIVSTIKKKLFWGRETQNSPKSPPPEHNLVNVLVFTHSL